PLHVRGEGRADAQEEDQEQDDEDRKEEPRPPLWRDAVVLLARRVEQVREADELVGREARDGDRDREVHDREPCDGEVRALRERVSQQRIEKENKERRKEE